MKPQTYKEELQTEGLRSEEWIPVPNDEHH